MLLINTTPTHTVLLFHTTFFLISLDQLNTTVLHSLLAIVIRIFDLHLLHLFLLHISAGREVWCLPIISVGQSFSEVGPLMFAKTYPKIVEE